MTAAEKRRAEYLSHVVETCLDGKICADLEEAIALALRVWEDGVRLGVHDNPRHKARAVEADE